MLSTVLETQGWVLCVEVGVLAVAALVGLLARR